MDLIQVLSKVIDISHSNIDINARINGILKILERNLENSTAAIYVLEKDRRLTLKYSTRRDPLILALSEFRPLLGEGVPGSVAQKREAQLFDIRSLPKRFGFLLLTQLDKVISDYSQFAFLPLSDESRCYGVLMIFSSRGTPFSEGEKRVFELVSKELTGLLKASELYRESGRRITELMALSEIGKVLISGRDLNSILRETALIVAKTLEADYVRILLKEKNGERSFRLTTYGHADDNVKEEIEAIEERLIREKGSLPNTSFDTYSIYAYPLVSKNVVIGVISVLARGEGKDDEKYHLLETISNYLSNGLENIILRAQLNDILAELNSANQRLIEQEKLKSLGEMTANIAHEIKNPLVVIGGFAKRLAKKLPLEQKERRYLNIILNEVSRLENILNEVLAYAKDVPLKRTLINMDELLSELIHFLKSDPHWDKVEIVKECEDGIPPVSCDPEQMKQVFFNIFVNAFEAMGAEGKIVVKIFKTEEGQTGYLCVSISDTGGGIDPLIFDNIFNPFFTTKERGTGLGLSISNKIVLSHRGKIEVENKRGVGATFLVYLPLNQNSTSEAGNGKMAQKKG